MVLKEYRVKVKALDLDVVKIDAEGSKAKILKGMGFLSLLKKFKYRVLHIDKDALIALLSN
ncbi:MAG: hypothetical protein ABWW69_03900, partial [Pyrodictiaceae archaeon]